jgi:hypothetical protein
MEDTMQKHGTMIHAVEVGIGILAGWSLNALKIRLSEKIEGMLTGLEGLTDDKREWIAWLIAVAIYGFLAFGGIAMPMIKGFPGAAAHLTYVMAGFGIGGLIDEIVNMPQMSKLTSAT